MSTYKAHIFKQRNVGHREEVKLKLFMPDGTPIDLSGSGGGGSDEGPTGFAWARGNDNWEAPMGSTAKVPFEYHGSNSESMSLFEEGGNTVGIELQRNGFYLIIFSGMKPDNVGIYYLDYLLDDEDGETYLFGDFGINFADEDSLTRTAAVFRGWEEENLYAPPKIFFYTDAVSSTPNQIGSRELTIIKL